MPNYRTEDIRNITLVGHSGVRQNNADRSAPGEIRKNR